MSEEWKEITLDQIYEFKSGLSKPRAEFGFGSGFVSFKDVFYNFFIPDELTELVNASESEQVKCSVKRGDVFLTRTSETFNELGMSSVALKNYERATFNGFTKRLRPLSEDTIYPEYAGYYFRSKYFRKLMNSFSTMSTRASLNNEILSKLSIRFPSFERQIAIANQLISLDQKIHLLRQQNATLEAMAQALFKSWFVDFDPVIDNALAAGRVLPEALAGRVATRRAVLAAGDYPVLPVGVRGLFPAGFVFSEELGRWVPGGWEATSLGKQFDIEMGQSPPGSTYNENGEGIPFYQGRRDFGFRFPTQRVYCTAPKRFAKKNDTLISVRAPVGDANLAMNDCCIGRGVGALRHKSGSVSYTYYFVMELSTVLKSYEAGGTVFGSINQKQLKSIEFCSPNISCIEAFEEKCSSIDKAVENNTTEIQTLTRLRDVLLPELISGRVRV